VKRAAAALAALTFAAMCSPAAARAGAVIDAARDAFGKLQDYTATITVHETDGKTTQDAGYAYKFMKPDDVRIDVLSGPKKGSGVVWLGGDTVKGHMGGFLSGIKRELPVHDPQTTSLRGDTIDTGTFGAMLDDFTRIKGTVSEGSGPLVNGEPTDTVTLIVADPTTDHGTTREVLYLSKLTHLPVKRERFAGDDLVKSEIITDTKVNVGLTTADFPF
jgi:outer membrane lipoprotein-sorting protein